MEFVTRQIDSQSVRQTERDRLTRERRERRAFSSVDRFFVSENGGWRAEGGRRVTNELPDRTASKGTRSPSIHPSSLAYASISNKRGMRARGETYD